MKITGLKTNHLTNPLGYDIQTPTVSFRVEETEAKRPRAIRLTAAEDADFERVIYDSGERADIRLAGERLPLTLRPRTRYYWKAEVWADNGEYAESDAAWFETAKREEPWEAQWIGSLSLGESSPVFKKEFTTTEKVRRGRIYMTGLGLYELYLDGKRVGDEYLAPGCNDYRQWIQYQTYEVSLLPGAHRLEVYLADGWYKGRFGLDHAENVYGDRCMMLLEMILTDTKGQETKIVSDGTWMAAASDIMSSSIYDGEVYVPSTGERKWIPADVLEGPTEKLCARYSQPVRVLETRTPEILHTPAGETVLDMGQNMAGFVRFYVDEPKGTRIHMQFGEVLQEGNFYRDNLRTAKAEFTYVSDGIAKEVGPHFTYYGFRYVKVEGFTKELTPEQFTGCVLYSDLEQTGWLSTSNAKVNQLISNAFWGQKCNYVDVPTDCPQRDERMGWTADTQVFSATACFNMDSYNFLRKYCHDIYETQKELGHVTSVVPAFHEDGPTCSVWGDAATIIPWNLYLYYGDVSILEEQFESMRQWVDSIYEIDEATGGRRFWDVGFHFGDWLALDGEGDDTFKGATEDGYIATAYYYNSAQIVAKSAKILGKAEEAARYGTLAEEIKAAMQAEYFTANGRLALTTQTAYALALYMDFAPEGSKERIAQFLREKLKVNKGYLKTGFVGTYILNRVLSDYGNNDMAYKLLLNEECPSWLYAVNMGATTIWERWNSILPDGRISGTEMNSLNHYSYGSVLEWIYRNVAGLHLCEEHPGFSEVLIAPQPDYRLTSCDMKYVSASGVYEIHWKVETSGEFELTVEVPFGCAATVQLPNTERAPERVESGRHVFRYLPETPIIKIYSCASSVNELTEAEGARTVFEQYVPNWQGIPGPMRDMTVEQLTDTPFVNLTEEQIGALNAQLKTC
ncbi:MAG: glycoside hydrolase family 78 protein [Lachnospiraceae bacterium]|nr:glycoside hydrolase family 78 protein [Lachnospiraceae bacterium]